MTKGKRQRYRYVLNGTACGNDPIGNFRLIASNNIKSDYHGAKALRVRIPDDLELTKYSCDPYSTTEDMRTLDELGHDVLIWDGFEKKWFMHNEFKGARLCDIPTGVRPWRWDLTIQERRNQQ